MEGQLNNTVVSGTQTGTETPMAQQKPLEDKVGNISNPLLENTDDNVGEETKQPINQFGIPIENNTEINVEEEVKTETNPEDEQNPLLNDVLNTLGQQDGIDEMLEGLGIEGTKFNGVDLGDFQELLDFETPESREEVLQEVKRLKGYGYGDEQIKEYFTNSLEQYQEGYNAAIAEMQGKGEYGNEPMSPAEIKANLEANLSRSEIMNIQPLLNWVKANVNSDILTNELLNGMFTDPTSIKVLNALYNGSMKNSGVRTQEPKIVNGVQNKMQIQPLQAMQFYSDWLSKQPSVTKEQTLEQINKLRGMIGSQSLEEFDELFNVLK